MRPVSPEDSVRENRKFPRVPTRLRCWCEGENVTFYARVGNISEGGLFLRTSTPLPHGSRAKVRLEPRGELEVEAEATVVWARTGETETQPGMGLRFDAVDERVKEQLKSLIDTELQRGRSPAPGG